MKEQGLKFDTDKPRLDLIPASALFSMGRVFGYGAKKYEDRNWEKGIEINRLYGALQRHLWAWYNGEEIDPESGFNHLDHAFCELAMMNEMKDSHPELDNRPNKIKISLDRNEFTKKSKPMTDEERRKYHQKLVNEHFDKKPEVIETPFGTIVFESALTGFTE